MRHEFHYHNSKNKVQKYNENESQNKDKKAKNVKSHKKKKTNSSKRQTSMYDIFLAVFCFFHLSERWFYSVERNG